jgi:adenosyl cobinamide kinase/adenosyl cobinamide phosphate guanylyltransferase
MMPRFDSDKEHDVQFLARPAVTDKELDRWVLIEHDQQMKQKWRVLVSKKDSYDYEVALN